MLNELLTNLIRLAEPGTSLLYLEASTQNMLSLMGATSATKGYQPRRAKVPFPSVVCLSVNDEINHGIPSNYILKDGDLLTIDCGLLVDNLAADAGLTIPIGEISPRDERLLRYTRRALKMGISVIKPGIKITEVGRAIESFADWNGFVIVKSMGGHAIGAAMHEEPRIPMYNVGLQMYTTDHNGKKKYYYKDYDNIPVFYEGQTVCIEPHLTYKDEFGKLDDDGWTVRTRDGRKAAMAEAMCRVTTGGVEILCNPGSFNES